jgi:hypothetical protein
MSLSVFLGRSTQRAMYNLAYSLNKTGHSAEAETLGERRSIFVAASLARSTRDTTDDGPISRQSRLQAGQYPEAEKLLWEASAVQERARALDHRRLGASAYELAILKESTQARTMRL